MNKTQILLTAGMFAIANSVFALTVIDQNLPEVSNPATGIYQIDSDLNLGSDTEWILEGITYVMPGVTLTVPAGTIVRGQPRTTGTAPGALVVTRGAEIYSVGSATNPVIWTTANVNTLVTPTRWSQPSDVFVDADPKNNPITDGDITNQWGAVVLLGYAPINTSDIDTGVSGEAYIEGLSTKDSRTTYGGGLPNDSSGSFVYNSIRYSGDGVSPDEIQGLTLGGVGQGTDIRFVDIYGSGDDGIEIFGGTANLKYISIAECDDDGYDIDHGYQGLTQFLFVLAGTRVDTDHCFEFDGDDCCDSKDDGNVFETEQPVTHPTIYNATVAAQRNGDGNGNADYGLDRLVYMRHGFGGQINNSIFANSDDADDGYFYIDNNNWQTDAASAGVGATDFAYPSTLPGEQLENGTLGLASTIWYDVADSTVANISGGVSSHPTDNFVAGTFADADPAKVLNNDASYPACTNNRVGTTGTATDLFFGQAAVGGFVGAWDQNSPKGLNPVPLGASVTQNLVPYTATFFDEVSYIGAFAPDQNAVLWTSGWTVWNTAGILVDNARAQDLL